MKRIIVIFLLVATVLIGNGQDVFRGEVRTKKDSLAIQGATVRSVKTSTMTTTDQSGRFQIQAMEGDSILISFQGFVPLRVQVSGLMEVVYLEEQNSQLKEIIVHSGFQAISKERATGAFSHVSKELFNRAAGSDIMSRLEGVTNGLLFDRRVQSSPDSEPSFQVRGLSSISKNNWGPLIVVDDFPYEGDINSINPDDILDVTILKDAAAASIWGARAGNGVIVFTTKKGRFNQPTRVSFSSSMSVQEKPDVYYSNDFINSGSFIDFERLLFEHGYYNSTLTNPSRPIVSPAVDIMVKHSDGEISRAQMEKELDILQGIDIRDQASTYLYRQQVEHRHGINLSGGSDRASYYISAGLDRTLHYQQGRDNSRITLNSFTTYKPRNFVEISLGLSYVNKSDNENGIGMQQIEPIGKRTLPYTRIANQAGDPLPVPYKFRSLYEDEAEFEGLLDWRYYPLGERDANDVWTKSGELRAQANLKLILLDGLNIEAKYQFQRVDMRRDFLANKESFHVRDLVNRFTQPDGTRVFPDGAYLNQTFNDHTAHSGRFQLNYNASLGNKHEITGIGGVDLRQIAQQGSSLVLYGYNPQTMTYQTQLDYLTYYPTRPISTSRIPNPRPILSDYIDRYLSYFGNASYEYDGRILVSGSFRWDASNLFGVETNRKGVPLWSAGLSWRLDRENFYNVEWLPDLRLRLTYGYNGNIDKSTTSFPTGSSGVDRNTGLVTARILTPGNSRLRWERVGNTNMGIDFSFWNRRLFGSVDYYIKRSTDLIGPIDLDPTTGVLRRHNVNYATMYSKGLDIELNNENKWGAFWWSPSVLLNFNKNKVEKYDFTNTTVNLVAGNAVVEGEPLGVFYSYPWHGLDPETGNPLVVIDGEVSQDYNTFVRDFPVEQLMKSGNNTPTHWGSLRNTVGWGNLSISAVISWKTGYAFRKNTIDYYQLARNWRAHADFENRWKKPGDEGHTNIPSAPVTQSQNRDRIYGRSFHTIEPGDHLRLQDLVLNYQLPKPIVMSLNFQSINLFAHAKNLGFIWRKTDVDIDPDMTSSLFPLAKTYSFGVRASF